MSHAWVRFSNKDDASSAVTRVTRYHVDEHHTVKGRKLTLERGVNLTRCESMEPFASDPQDLIAVVQHLGYTDALRRRDLTAQSASETGPRAVLIPIAKTAEWWALAHDERLALLRASGRSLGHFDIGASYASRIHRRLYHCRYLPFSRWDFLTYFEFAEEHAVAFRELLQELRDVERNPEWRFVEHETEIWMTKLDPH
jgi:hypothetical protein